MPAIAAAGPVSRIAAHRDAVCDDADNSSGVDVFMKEQLRRAGEERIIFAAVAITQIGKLSKGVPHVVNSLCKAALLNVSLLEEQVVGVANVGSA